MTDKGNVIPFRAKAETGSLFTESHEAEIEFSQMSLLYYVDAGKYYLVASPVMDGPDIHKMLGPFANWQEAFAALADYVNELKNAGCQNHSE